MGCWLPGSRTTVVVVFGTWAGVFFLALSGSNLFEPCLEPRQIISWNILLYHPKHTIPNKLMYLCIRQGDDLFGVFGVEPFLDRQRHSFVPCPKASPAHKHGSQVNNNLFLWYFRLPPQGVAATDGRPDFFVFSLSFL